MPFTYDLATSVGKTRLLIPDTDATGKHIFEDAEITEFISQASGNVNLAAAKALESAARNAALRLKFSRILDIEADSAALLEALMSSAKRLREDAKQADIAGTATLGFAIAQQAHGVFGRKELLEKELIRQQA